VPVWHAAAAVVVGALLAVAWPTLGSASPAITGTTILATAGVPFSGVIASSTLSPGGISLDWGDGTGESAGSIAADGSITGAHTYATAGSFTITMTSGATVGTSTAVVLTASQSAVVAGTDATMVPDGGSGSATVTPPGPGVTATLQQPTGPATLFVAVYSANPESAPLLAGGFYDVRVIGGGTTPTLIVTFHYTGLAGTPLLVFFDATSGQFVPVQSPSIIVNTAMQTITVTLNSATTPSLTQLTGDVFAAAAPAPVIPSATFTG